MTTDLEIPVTFKGLNIIIPSPLNSVYIYAATILIDPGPSDADNGKPDICTGSPP